MLLEEDMNKSISKSDLKTLIKTTMREMRGFPLEKKLPEILRKALALCPKCGNALSTKGNDVWGCECGYNGPNQPLEESTPKEDQEWFSHYADFPGYKMPEPEEPYGKVNVHYWLSPAGNFYDAEK